MMDAAGLDSAPTYVYATAIAVIAICVVLFIALQGLVLNWSLSLVAFTPVGYLYACFVAFAMTLSGSFIVALIRTVLPDTGQWVLTCYCFVAGAFALMLLVQCSPFQAALAYVCYSLLSFMTVFGVVVILFALMFFAAPFCGDSSGQGMRSSCGSGLNAALGSVLGSSRCREAQRPEPTPVKYSPSESGSSAIQANPF